MLFRKIRSCRLQASSLSLSVLIFRPDSLSLSNGVRGQAVNVLASWWPGHGRYFLGEDVVHVIDHGGSFVSRLPAPAYVTPSV
jgi:hypothetical protein